MIRTSQDSIAQALAYETWFGQAAHARIAGKKAAGERRLLELGLAEAAAGAGDIKCRESLATERRRSRPRHRQLDDAVDTPVGCVTRDSPPVPMGIPQKALGVDGHSVGKAGIVGNGRKHAPRAHFAGGWINIIAKYSA